MAGLQMVTAEVADIAKMEARAMVLEPLVEMEQMTEHCLSVEVAAVLEQTVRQEH
jgi:hypothetical protein